jgi:hypothetical protein
LSFTSVVIIHQWIRHSQLTNTEREAIKKAITILNGGQQFSIDTPLAGDAAILRCLLERTK